MSNHFPNTECTFVHRVVKRDPEALRNFIKNYREPLLAYASRDQRIKNPQDAEDIISDFFTEFIDHKKTFTYDPLKGHFRSYLLGALNKRINSFVRKANTQKRGGGIVHLPLEENPDIPDSSGDQIFMQEWANHIRSRAEARVMAHKGTRDNTLLYPYLTKPAPDFHELGAQLGITPDAVVRRLEALHQMFWMHLRAEIRESLFSPSESEIDAELSLLRKYFFI